MKTNRTHFMVLMAAAVAVSTFAAPLPGLSSVLAAGPAPASAVSPGFQKLQALAGDWEGKDNRGHPVKTSFKAIAGNTAVLENLTMHDMDEMVTLYSLDKGSIFLMHYCPTNNQPKMRATPGEADVSELTFAFEGAGNLASESEGHEQKLVLEFKDKDHIVEHWTWRQQGKDIQFVYDLARKR